MPNSLPLKLDHHQLVAAGETALSSEVHSLSLKHRRLASGMSDGVDVLEVRNGDFTFRVLPTRGMGIHQAVYKGTQIGWQSPVNGPVHPKFVPLSDPSGLGWLDGFDELLVRCGLESNGAPEHDEETGRLLYGLHGKIANRPAENLTAELSDSGELTIRGEVPETRFLVYNVALETEIKTATGEHGFRIKDTIVNRGSHHAAAQMLYHINFGPPLLGAGSQLVCPAKRIVPRNEHSASDIKNWDLYQGPKSGFQEMVYFFELEADAQGETQVLLKDAAGNRGVSLRFNISQLPRFIAWKNTADEADGYVTGLEPATNFPNPRSFERDHGREIQLAGGERYEIDLAFTFHPDAAEVQEVEQSIRKLTGGKPATLETAPLSQWCAP
ncbi:MAG: aldose 1-epimerase family protein [Pirellulaceae bacterium]